ncbi:DUF6630 family protein [Deinococcus sp.]|uniref:DUF6630 family protein n=1 Tax=Deinococcus sp. TaxID=47478 RepID=UPI003C7A115B
MLDIILAPLEAEQPGLCQSVRQRFAETRLDLDSDELYALKEALQDAPGEYPPGWWLDPAQSRWWLCLHVDWKAWDEVEWQVQAMARTLKLEGGGFVSRVAAGPAPLMLDVLAEASAWLRLLGHGLLYLDTEGDEYLAVPVRQELLDAAADIARRLNIPTFLA